MTRRSDRITGYCFKCSPAGDEDGRPVWFCEMLRGKEIIDGMRAEIKPKYYELPKPLMCVPDEYDGVKPDVKWLTRSGLNADLLNLFRASYAPSTGGIYFPLNPRMTPSEGGWIVRKPDGSWFKSPTEHSRALWRAGDYGGAIYDTDGALVLVEDIASAIKTFIAGFDAIALLGTKLSTDIKYELAKVCSERDAVIWLDKDKHGSRDENDLYRFLHSITSKGVFRVRKPEPKLLGAAKIFGIVRAAIAG